MEVQLETCSLNERKKTKWNVALLVAEREESAARGDFFYRESYGKPGVGRRIMGRKKVVLVGEQKKWPYKGKEI